MRTARSLLELLDSFEKDLDDGAFPAIEDLPPEPVAAVTTRPTSRCANPAPLLAAKNSAVPRGVIGIPSLPEPKGERRSDGRGNDGNRSLSAVYQTSRDRQWPLRSQGGVAST